MSLGIREACVEELVFDLGLGGHVDLDSLWRDRWKYWGWGKRGYQSLSYQQLILTAVSGTAPGAVGGTEDHMAPITVQRGARQGDGGCRTVGQELWVRAARLRGIRPCRSGACPAGK